MEGLRNPPAPSQDLIRFASEARRLPRARNKLSNQPFPELHMPERLLLGPGPSNVHPRVMKAMASPVVGHLDPEFIAVMEGVKKMMRLVFRTANEITFPVSGTGSAGMETVLANLIEEGDEVVIGTASVFGTRMVELATRLGARIHRVDAEW